MGANADYHEALETAERLKVVRDAAVLELTAANTVRAVAEMTGLSAGRVQQIVDRARKSG